jgi:hypothetical protein
MATLDDPVVSYKHCSAEDQNDLLDDALKNDTYKYEPQKQSPLLPEELDRLKVTYPIKNKTKSQNA